MHSSRGPARGEGSTLTNYLVLGCFSQSLGARVERLSERAGASLGIMYWEIQLEIVIERFGTTEGSGASSESRCYAAGYCK